MTLQDREYQQRMIQEARLKLRKVNSVLMQAPTGAGKTGMAAMITRNTLSKDLTSWFVCHRDFLLDQTALTFDKVGIPYGFIAAGRPFNPFARCQICGIDTLKRRIDSGNILKPNVIQWDEAQHIAAAGWTKVFQWAQGSKHLGWSATPERLDGKGLDGFFQDIVVGPSVSELIEDGWLSDYKAFAPTTPDMTGIHTVAGDYNRGEVEDLMDTSQIIGDMVKHYKHKASGKRGIYFGVSIEHSQHIAAMFNANGIRAMHLDGGDPTHVRRAAAKAFAAGEIEILTNVDLFGEGYDLAAQAGRDVTIDCVGLARPTKSLSLHLQQCGRALRPHADKDHAVILDHAGNVMRHGLPDDNREWTLKGRTKKKKSEDAGPPTRMCPQCFGLQSRSLLTCKYCGFAFPPPDGGRSVEEIAGDLTEIDVKAARKSALAEERACRTVEALVELAKKRGYRHPERWAAHKFTAREAAVTKRIASQAAYYMKERF